ncbi:Leucine-rich_repeat domain superfamily [Hexamita inflata]|uniref:Leucine-rich repeat domain superfamily n=1 Tax=Hexamita inflata TaxID=28002 RepID=A0AA86N988_9EUKA|nr:Leucine-rich repeat domain superfamily [Hexamita inflata]
MEEKRVVSQMQKLQRLSLNKCEFKDVYLLQSLTQLRDLSLTGNSLKNEDFMDVRFRLLQTLDVSCNKLTSLDHISDVSDRKAVLRRWPVVFPRGAGLIQEQALRPVRPDAPPASEEPERPEKRARREADAAHKAAGTENSQYHTNRIVEFENIQVILLLWSCKIEGTQKLGRSSI